MPDRLGIPTRSGKDLFDATVPFAEEFRTRSWWYVGSTFVVLIALQTSAAIAPWWPLRLAASILGGLVLVSACLYPVPRLQAWLAAIGIAAGKGRVLPARPADGHSAAPLAL
jgi:hypothetical protein